MEGCLKLPLHGKSLPAVALRVRPGPHGIQEFETCWLPASFPKGQCRHQLHLSQVWGSKTTAMFVDQSGGGGVLSGNLTPSSSQTRTWQWPILGSSFLVPD